MIHCNSCILSIDAGGTSLKAALVHTDSQAGGYPCLTRKTFFSVPVNSSGTKEDILTAYKTVVCKGAIMAADKHLRICHVALCTPGPFDYVKGCSLMKHKYQATYEIPLAPYLMEGLGYEVPCTFLHDSSAFLLGAAQIESIQKQKICGVTIGTGLGFACMIDGKIQETPSGGPSISIYARPYMDGIAEDYVSKRGIMQRYHAKQKTSLLQLTVAEIASKAREGDLTALETFADTGYHLGQILLPILRDYQFETVVLGGAISKSADLFLTQLSGILSDTGATIYPVSDIDLVPIVGAVQYVTYHNSNSL